MLYAGNSIENLPEFNFQRLLNVDQNPKRKCENCLGFQEIHSRRIGKCEKLP
jgi:hypothetical protein